MLSHSLVLILTGSIENVQQGYLVVDDALLAIRVFDSWIPFEDESILDELDRESRLSDGSTTDDDELVLAEELSYGHDEAAASPHNF